VTVYREQVAAALQAVRIKGQARYAWLGRGSRRLPSALLAEMDAAQRRDYLVTCLREDLYASFYCPGRPVPARWELPEPVHADPWLARAMSAANTGRGSWEPGWTVERLEGDEAVVTAPRMRARIPVDDCSTFDGPLRAGSAVRVRMPKELPRLSPGFYTVVSDAVEAHASPRPLVRAYWNVGRAGAPALVRELTSRLNAMEMPFRLKVADHGHRLDRCDAAVLYLAGDAFIDMCATLADIAAVLTAFLQARVPAFTLELAPGVGLAEDIEGEDQSFGARRCALLAEGIVRAYEQGATQLSAQLDVLAATFAEAGVQIDAPYLEPKLGGEHVL
jgi:class II lanthipeptide synthase